MEGDAGASRLNPADADVSSSPEVTASDSSGSGAGADQASSEVTASDSSGSGAGVDSADEAVPTSPVVEHRASRLGRAWVVGIAAVLLVLAGGIGTGGYFALRFHRESQVIAGNDVAALKAATDCIAATQAPDIAAIAATEQKIIDCATGDFRAQAILYSSLLVEAYQAANAHVQVSDIRAAVERNNDDGSVDVLVALRVKVTNAEVKDQETGYRLRVKMARDEGQYRIAKLDQVAK